MLQFQGSRGWSGARVNGVKPATRVHWRLYHHGSSQLMLGSMIPGTEVGLEAGSASTGLEFEAAVAPLILDDGLNSWTIGDSQFLGPRLCLGMVDSIGPRTMWASFEHRMN